jgi:tRNA U34 5-methylaminomethyl-2-thiouridine-forming methyltransferase MnmC
MKAPLTIITTEDGSHSLLHEALNETYHSIHGAVTESNHVFIRNGWDHLINMGIEAVNILEIGFGTGLNAVLTLQAARHANRAVLYHTLEPYPVPEEIINQLNYTEQVIPGLSPDDWLQLHQVSWGSKNLIEDQFVLYKQQIKLEEAHFQNSFDLVYYDAFAPNKQSEMWDESHILMVQRAMKPGGVLVTYCAQGQFRRNLKAVGLAVESLPGPPGKKEMTRATKPMQT